MEDRKLRKERTGLVVSNKMEKSIIVQIDHREKHPIYGKFVRRRSRFVAHDEKNECNIGDIVLIMESKPISKDKKWILSKIIEKSK